MSRIHDALVKAQQERASQGNAPVEPLGDQAMMPPGVDARVATVAAQAGVATAAPARTLVTLDLLRERCAQPAWKPDTSHLLFFNQHEQTLPGMEEFRTLRSRLYHLQEKQPLKIVLVASALPGEGKSFVASNLAHALVRQHGRRALLIDCDLRWPRLHIALGAPESPGLSDYLLGNADELAVVQKSPIDNLYFLPGGKAATNPAELLANGRLGQLLHALTPCFDWIIIDSPPAMPVSDASLIVKSCDGVLLVVRSGDTPYDVAQKTRQAFHDKPVLGVVLNRVGKSESYSSTYYAKYYNERKSAEMV